ncbi:MAG: NAD(P)H-hydrate dehydratase [Verrucomicrobiales bacterium]|nr:NAD(P)H-hydrate dehydratase [Verrucomicrobiales bacterium]
MLVTCEQMAAAEARLFATGVSAEPLMNEAGGKCAEAIRQFFPRPAEAVIFCGKGNNGGDALVVARWLKRWGWEVTIHYSHGRDDLSELALKKRDEWEAEPETTGVPRENSLILVDGLLGIGATGSLRGRILSSAQRLNERRNKQFGTCFAIDIPTGLNADTGESGEGAVTADYTLSISCPKAGFAADAALSRIGRLVEIPLEIPVPEADDSIRFLFPSNLNSRLPRRSFDQHKGDSGRVLIIAGSRGLTGAAVLSALGASRSGAGLTTVCVPEEIYPIVAGQCPAEVMVRPVSSIREALEFQHDVVAIGPGLGRNRDRSVIEALLHHEKPMVVDADALNALAGAGISPKRLPSDRLLTPHPGELARLTNRSGNRNELTRNLADEWGITLLHKGSRTAIATPGHPLELNTTGHPGMASGGMGDVLTGTCASLIGQGVSLHDSAALGSWLLGRAAEIARDSEEIAPESVSAVIVAESLGKALRSLRLSSY